MAQGVTIKGKTAEGESVEVLVDADGSLSVTDIASETLAQALYDVILRLQPLQNTIPYARDASDQMRVVVSSGSITSNTSTLWNNGTYQSYYGGTGAIQSVDPREQLELQSLTNMNLLRQRWQIT